MSGYTRPRLTLGELDTRRGGAEGPMSAEPGFNGLWRRLHRNGKPQLLLLPSNRLE